MRDNLFEALERKAIEKRLPYECTFQLTYHCNYHCPMCYVRMTDNQAAPYGRLRTVDEWIEMARQVRDAGVFYLILTGGECTQYPGFIELYKAVYQMGFRVTLMSNAADYSDELKEVLRQYPPYGVTTTFYGGSNETYRKVTGDPKGFDKVVENIRFLLSLGVPVRANYTMVQDNIRDYPLIEAICKELNVNCYPVKDLFPHVWDKSLANVSRFRLTPAEQACVSCRSAEEVEIALADAQELAKEWKPEYLPTARNENPPQSFCNGSASNAAILWNGDMQTCLMLEGAPAYKPFEIGFAAAWKQLQSERDARFTTSPVCAACEMITDCNHHCSARNFLGTGDFYTPDPDICQYVWLKRKYKALLSQQNQDKN